MAVHADSKRTIRSKVRSTTIRSQRSDKYNVPPFNPDALLKSLQADTPAPNLAYSFGRV